MATSPNGKQSNPFPNEHNCRLALRKLGVTVRCNVFRDCDEIEGLENFGPDLSDKAMNRLRLLINRRYQFLMKKEFFYDVVSDLAFDHRYHPVHDFLNGLTWDGTPRINTWLTTYGKAKDTPYTRAVSKLMLIAAVRRIRNPGCKFDEMAVLEGGQGTDKSTALKTLAVNEDWFTDDLPLGVESKVMIEQLSGKWIVEIADLHKHKGAPLQKIKAQLSRTRDVARLAYGRNPGSHRRQVVFFGTTNEETYLNDPTGERRFWPVMTGGFDIEALKRERHQLWAEAAHREAKGESIRMDHSLGVMRQLSRPLEPSSIPGKKSSNCTSQAMIMPKSLELLSQRPSLTCLRVGSVNRRVVA